MHTCRSVGTLYTQENFSVKTHFWGEGLHILNMDFPVVAKCEHTYKDICMFIQYTIYVYINRISGWKLTQVIEKVYSYMTHRTNDLRVYWLQFSSKQRACIFRVVRLMTWKEITWLGFPLMANPQEWSDSLLGGILFEQEFHYKWLLLMSVILVFDTFHWKISSEGFISNVLIPLQPEFFPVVYSERYTEKNSVT